MDSDSEQPIAPAADPAQADIRGEVELTLSDIEAGLSSLPRAKIARAVALAGAVLVVGAVAYRWQEGKDRTTLLVVGLFLLVLLLVNRNPAKKIARRVYDSLPADAKRLSVSIDEAGVRLRSGGAESELPWSGICKLVETREVWVVFVSRENAQILPKRAFTEAMSARLRELGRQKVVACDEPFLTAELRRRMWFWLLSFLVVWGLWFFFGRG